MRIILLGAPGAGKGTLATMIKEKLSIPHVSTGDILREEMKSGSALGSTVKSFVESGQLVPDDIITQIVDNKLTNDPQLGKGYMLDGFPRTRPQAEKLDEITRRIGKPLELALYLDVSLPVIIQRLTGRRICRKCGAIYHSTNKPPKKDGICDICSGELYQRADDHEETIRKRMDVYTESTAPIIEYYQAQGILMKLQGDLDTSVLLEQIIKKLHEGQESNRDKN